MKRDLLAVIDMQRVYLEGEWNVPRMREAERNVLRLLPAFAHRVFTRHLPAAQPAGTWARYNEAWKHINDDEEGAQLLESLAPYAESCLEKTTYSAFGSSAFAQEAEQAGRLFICGVQSEFCVLSTVFDAVDRGIDVVYVDDACAGETDQLEQAVVEIVRRMPCQAALMSTDQVLREVRNG